MESIAVKNLYKKYKISQRQEGFAGILSVGIKSCKIGWTVIKILYFVLKGKKQHMGKLIILRGNSGSGKTTVAKALQKKLGRNTMLISQDEVRRNMLWVDDGIDTKALPLMAELLR